MGGYALDDMKLSGLTLALFEDMGWYEVNWDMEQVLEFGLASGCEFATEKCAEKGAYPIP